MLAVALVNFHDHHTVMSKMSKAANKVVIPKIPARTYSTMKPRMKTLIRVLIEWMAAWYQTRNQAKQQRFGQESRGTELEFRFQSYR